MSRGVISRACRTPSNAAQSFTPADRCDRRRIALFGCMRHRIGRESIGWNNAEDYMTIRKLMLRQWTNGDASKNKYAVGAQSVMRMCLIRILRVYA